MNGPDFVALSCASICRYLTPSASHPFIPGFSKVSPTGSRTAFSCSCSFDLLRPTATLASACHKLAHVAAEGSISYSSQHCGSSGDHIPRIAHAELHHLDPMSDVSPTSLPSFDSLTRTFSFCFGSNLDPCYIKISVEFF